MSEARIEQSIRHLVVPIGSIKPDPHNARTHGPRNLEAVRQSLERFGQQKPVVVDERGFVRAGNATVLSALALGWTEIAAAVVDLTDEELVAYAIADNRTAELAEWDFQVLAEHFRAFVDSGNLAGIGFTEEEMAPFMNEWAPPPPEGDLEDSFQRPGAPIVVDDEQAAAFDRAHALVNEERGEEVDEGEVVQVLALAVLEPEKKRRKKPR